MGTPFTKDMNIITNFLKDMDIIAALDDQPNDVGGLTAAELKAKFDEGGKAIQSFLNDTLIPEVVGLDATETSRKTAEQGRVAAEQARVTAEQGRVTAEQARVTADAEREHAEYLRQSGETGRIQGENTRRTQEAGRAREELARVEAEQGRITAETARAEAEAARAAAEAQRVDSTTGIVAQSTKQAQNAAASAAAAAASETAAGQSAAAASTGGEQAAASAQTAATAAATAADAAQSAQSWAVGGTGTRPDEDRDNAKYWADVAQSAAVGGTRTCRLVVGSAADGWTATDCDYLCDGVDDQVELQAAIAALPESGGEIRLLDGSYHLSAQFILDKSDVTIRGTPGATKLFTAYNITGLKFFVRITADRCTLSGLWLSTGEGFSGGMACGVEVSGKEVVLESLDFRNFALTALGVNPTAEDCSVRFCRTSEKGGIVVSAPRCTVYGCFVGEGGLLNNGAEALIFCNRIRGMNSTICGSHSVATNNLFDASAYFRVYGVYIGNIGEYGGITFVGNIVKANQSGYNFSMRLDGNENIVSGNVLVGYGPDDGGTDNQIDGNIITTGGVSDGV